MQTPKQTPQFDQDKATTIGFTGRCPHCQNDIHFELRANLGMGYATEEEAEILQLAESTGVLPSFETATKLRPKASGAFRNVKLTFLKFIRGATAKKLSGDEILGLEKAFGRHRFAVYCSGDMTAIFLDGELRMFMPIVFLQSRAPRVMVAGETMRVAAPVGEAMKPLVDWVKTNRGYVPADGKLFLAEIRKRSFGAFANIV